MSLENSISLRRHPDIVLITDTPKGRGIFAAAPIPSQSILETCPILVLDPQENKEHIEKTELFHYTYNWPLPQSNSSDSPPSHVPRKPKQTQAVILGLGSMFNHSSQNQNVGWERDFERGIITYKTLRDIEKGEELCISYGPRLTFVDADAPKPIDEGDGSGLLYSIQIDDSDDETTMN